MDKFTSQKIIKDIDSIKKSLANVDKTLALQHQSISEHIRRTTLLEKKLEPVEEHVEQMRGVGKFITVVSVIVGLALGIFALLQHFGVMK